MHFTTLVELERVSQLVATYEMVGAETVHAGTGSGPRKAGTRGLLRACRAHAADVMQHGKALKSARESARLPTALVPRLGYILQPIKNLRRQLPAQVSGVARRKAGQRAISPSGWQWLR
jgi:hypothetical protein